eukprot:6328118-Amphidinium_carterae.1
MNEKHDLTTRGTSCARATNDAMEQLLKYLLKNNDTEPDYIVRRLNATPALSRSGDNYTTTQQSHNNTFRRISS